MRGYDYFEPVHIQSSALFSEDEADTRHGIAYDMYTCEGCGHTYDGNAQCTCGGLGYASDTEEGESSEDEGASNDTDKENFHSQEF